MKPFRPLLAATLESDDQLEGLAYPLIASPKIDGVRCLIHPELGPVTRSLKAIPNEHVRKLLNKPEFKGLDGEIVLGPKNAVDVFARSISAVMSHDGEPDITYWVFDSTEEPNAEYGARLRGAHRQILEYMHLHKHVQRLEYITCHDRHGVLSYEQQCLESGFEGIMLRHTNGKYKYGRSTFKEQILIKVKRFTDDEATIVDFQELYHNENPQTRDSLGLAERNDRTAGMRAGNTLGALLVECPRFPDTFAVGSGFDQNLRAEIWSRRDYYRGKRITFKYQKIGIVDKPRFPIFKGFRPME